MTETGKRLIAAAREMADSVKPAPITDERLAEIRAGLEGVTLKEAAHAAHAAFQAIIRREHPYLPPVRPLSEEKQYLQDAYEEMVKEAAAVYAPALLSRLDTAEAEVEICHELIRKLTGLGTLPPPPSES